MPQFGESSLPAPFPSWVAGSFPTQISQHPHPGTPRIDGRLRWPSDLRQLALHGRAWGRLYWQESAPPSNSGIYDHYETVYWDWWATAPSEATAWTSKSTSGRAALLRLRYLDVLPVAGIAGSELYVEFFKDEVSIGTRTLEVPDSPTGLQFNTVLGPGVVPNANTHPPYDQAIGPGQWASIEDIPAPECYEFFDTQRTVPSAFESDPAGMAAIKVRIEQFGWGDNEFNPGGGYTRVQRLFANAIRSDWIVRPVFHGVSGWIPSWLEFKSTFFWDPVATDGLGTFGLYYGFAIRVIFNSDLFLWTLHIRTWRASTVDPSWEIPISQSLDSGVSFLLGVNGALFASNFSAPAPYESRNIEDNQIFNEIWPRFGPMGPFGLLGFDPIRVSLLNTSAFERGTELPSQGPLDMARQTKDTLVFKPVAAQPIQGNPRMIFTDATYNSAGFWQPGLFTDRLVIPAGVRRVRGYCAFDASSANSALSCQIRVDQSSGPGQSIFQEPSGGNTSRRGVAILAPTEVNENDTISVFVNSAVGSLTSNQTRNWLYLEELNDDRHPISVSAVPYDELIPAAGSQIFGFRVPPSLDGYSIESISASLGLSRSTSGDVEAALYWIRQVGRMVEDITDDPITIEANEWTSESAANPPTTFPSALTALEGDILMCAIAAAGTGAQGLVINLDMVEPI